MDDAVKTKEGVRIGDKKDKVVSAYGSDYTEADGQLLYESGNTRLSFVMKDDEVQSIIYSVNNSMEQRIFMSIQYMCCIGIYAASAPF